MAKCCYLEADEYGDTLECTAPAEFVVVSPGLGRLGTVCILHLGPFVAYVGGVILVDPLH